MTKQEYLEIEPNFPIAACDCTSKPVRINMDDDKWRCPACKRTWEYEIPDQYQSHLTP